MKNTQDKRPETRKQRDARIRRAKITEWQKREYQLVEEVTRLTQEELRLQNRITDAQAIYDAFLQGLLTWSRAELVIELIDRWQDGQFFAMVDRKTVDPSFVAEQILRHKRYDLHMERLAYELRVVQHQLAQVRLTMSIGEVQQALRLGKAVHMEHEGRSVTVLAITQEGSHHLLVTWSHPDFDHDQLDRVAVHTLFEIEDPHEKKGHDHGRDNE